MSATTQDGRETMSAETTSKWETLFIRIAGWCGAIIAICTAIGTMVFLYVCIDWVLKGMK